MNNFHVITGGPGSGKTSLINELNNNGFLTVPEEGRRIIKEQIEFSGEGLPWKNKAAFATLMLDASLESYYKMIHEAAGSLVFFDRGIPDTIGYMELENIPVFPETEQIILANPYHTNVFMLPPWKSIYETDNERKQSWQEAVNTYEIMRDIYSRYGYNIINVPFDTIINRKDFILNNL
ncbi:AAA family ATPase [Elizabethkingia anophelis]|uniref:AAA family ATPase n=1 Tax=Elizabethkingia anophelis TaxID=1117645 RepID=UPI0021A35947|nr:AAA family ATPase [Elizabethkingia anophelis]MCT3976577.1 AAA family ATPase [Elizabethkingia anophelis]MCT4042392.1 AAA family ATPase [Elizabethkingia anophelis]MDV3865556.1 ATPase [Elizabethkingia anophelis]